MRQIKKIPKKDLEKYIIIGCGAFPGMDIHTSDARKRVLERFSKRYDCQSTHFLGVYDKSEMLGGIILYDYHMNLFNHKVKAGGAGFLAVSLMHKKEHVGRDLCLHFFKHYRKQKAPFALLWPFRPDFYRKMGAGYAGKHSLYRFKPSTIPSGMSKNDVRELEKKDMKKVIACFNRFADSHHGMVYDFEEYRKFQFNVGEGHRAIGYEKNKILEGFLIYTFKKGGLPHFLDNEIQIKELIYNSPEALLGLMAYLRTQNDQIPYINYNGPDDYFHHFLNDPRNESRMMHPPVYHESNLQTLGVMYRSINTRLIFETLKDRSFNGVDVKLKLTVEDSFLKENNGSLVIYFEDGYPSLQKSTAKYDVELKLKNEDFTSLILGSVDLKSLYNYGRAKLSKTAFVEKLNLLFKTEQKPFCLTDF